jgi:hypothetical protein
VLILKPPFSRLSSVLVLLLLCMAQPLSASRIPHNRKPAVDQVTATYDTATLTEDTSWSGVILIKGGVMVAPQTTLRIEPGTIIRFMPAKGSRQLSRLVIMGRIQSIGTADRPILFAPNQAISNKGDWGGLLLLSSEKRNQIEHCRIEGAETGLEGRFSTLTAKALSITRSTTGCLLRDCTATLTSPSINACDTGFEAHDSELELRDAVIAANRLGLNLFHSSVVMTSAAVTGSTRLAMVTENCRLKLTSCEISDNAVGVRISGGEGQIVLSRFVRNRDTALQLDAARLKVNRCQIAENERDGLKLADDRSSVWGNAIFGNKGYNLAYTGRERVNVTQNWWGSSDEAIILSKLSASVSVLRSGMVTAYPWLTETPALFP